MFKNDASGVLCVQLACVRYTERVYIYVYNTLTHTLLWYMFVYAHYELR